MIKIFVELCIVGGSYRKYEFEVQKNMLLHEFLQNYLPSGGNYVYTVDDKGLLNEKLKHNMLIKKVFLELKN